MVALTRQLRCMVQPEEMENKQGDTDAGRQAWEVQVGRLVMRFHSFELLDEVFEAFRTTNQRRGGHASFPQLLADAKHYKKYYFFEH